ncbi:uncharacterized protein VTP21DRAFT_1222 [Calcarisporiella thermophila]|uniref:uncharacterized protein n=1 Tax=Calcarisporiella thermophila TaxID=911321 RepID=UPI003744637B
MGDGLAEVEPSSRRGWRGAAIGGRRAGASKTELEQVKQATKNVGRKIASLNSFSRSLLGRVFLLVHTKVIFEDAADVNGAICRSYHKTAKVLQVASELSR